VINPSDTSEKSLATPKNAYEKKEDQGMSFQPSKVKAIENKART
jgi:hypothetical protein